MWHKKCGVLASICALVLCGCVTGRSCDDAPEVRLSRTPTELAINNGINNYDEGNYPASLAILQGLVDNKAASKGEKLLAYKYLAFIHCVSSREKMCSESFQKALEIDPKFNLSAAEAGHPIWGPVFKSVKSKPAK